MKDSTSANRLTQVRVLFETISELPPNERSVYLEEACEGDDDLKQELVALLDEQSSVDSPFEDLVNDMIWPALKSIGSNPSFLEHWLNEVEADLETSDPLIGKSITHFKIIRPIGRGGMGLVYLAKDQTLDREVALKFLPPSLSSDREAKERFIHEAKAVSGLDHPHIAMVHEIDETADHQLFIAMGYYPGETLKQKIEKGAVSSEKTIDYAIQLASGLAKVHQHGVIHRDIKPGNIMVTEEDSVKLLDFGLAKLSYSSGYTQVGQMMGTVSYMSPEQARGVEVDHRTDIWSMGIVLYEILTGKRPFDGEDTQSTIHAILESDPKPPAAPDEEIPKPLQEILGLCLAKNPDLRYQYAGDLLMDLQRAKEGLSPKKRGGAITWNRRLRRRRLIAASITLTILTVVILSIQFLNSPDKVIFTPITEGAVVNDTGNFADLSWGDYDNDGFVDVYVTNQAADSPNNLYHNNGDGSFTRISEGIVATDRFGAMSPAWADQDNDGNLDLFVCSEYGVDVFYRNQGDGTFTKETEGAWVNTEGSGNITAWGDYDNDGFVDLYVANFGTPVHEANFLYHNRGDGTMKVIKNVTNALTGASHGILWTDYDNDGDVDLFVGGQEQLQFRNEDEGTFTWVSPAMGGMPRSLEDVDVGFNSGDYDNDGDLDIIYTTWKPKPPSTLLYRNEGGSRFVDSTHALPSAGAIRAMGSSWGDYDNDGYLDLFITNRMGNNVLYHNEGNGTFRLVTDSPLAKEGNLSTGASWVDFDNDGDLDLMVANGIWSDFSQSCEFYRNEGSPNNWILLNLIGTVSNRSAIGAKVRALANIRGKRVAQLREVSGGHSSDLRVHFGLGDAKTIDTIRVEWPSGIVQELKDVATNKFLTIRERAGTP